MKKKAIRLSKSAFSIALALCMLFSCVLQSGAAQIQSESTGASSITVYFQDNYNWGTVYVFSGSNMTVRKNSDGYGYDVYGGSLDSGWLTMDKVPGTTNIYKKTLTVYDGKVAFAKAKSNQGGYFNNCSQCAVTPSGMTNGTLLNIWTGNSDQVTYMNSTSYRKYNTYSYTPPVPYITGIKGDWSNGDAMTFDSGNNFYYSFNGDGSDKYFRFKVDSTYYEAYNDGFNLETDGDYKPYDGSTSNKKYGTRTGNSAAFKLTASTGYAYKIYFDIDGKKAWFTKTAISYSVLLGTVSNGSITRSATTATSGSIVTLTTSPSASYNDVKPTVTKASGGTVTVTKTADNKYTFTMPGENVTVTATFPLKSYNITFSQPSNGSIKVNNSTSSPVSVNHNNSISLVIAPNSGYKIKTLTDNGTAVSAAVGLTSAYTYKIDKVTAAHTIAATMESANTPLSAPTNVKLSSTSVIAAPGESVTLSWNSVANAGSYKIYKGTDTNPVATVTTTSYSIAKKYSNADTYYVVASPSNTASYSDSAKSSGVTLTVTRTALPTPNVNINPTDISSGGSTTATFSNYASSLSSYISGGYATLIRGTGNYGATGGSYTSNTAVSSTMGSETLSPTSDIQYGYYMSVTTAGSEYYYQSGNSSFTNVKVYAKPAYRIAGDSNFIGSAKWDYANGKEINNYVSNGVYYFITQSVSAGDHWFSLFDSSGSQYSGNNGTSDYTLSLGESNKCTIVKNTNHKSFKINGTGVFMIFFDVTSSQIWVTQNTWAVSPHVYYQSYNLTTDAYNTAEAGTTGGTISPEDETILVNKNSSVTLTASPKSGYSFAGWYSSSSFTGTPLSTSTSYSYKPSASGDIYALFKENTPTHYTITVANVANAVVRATYNGTTYQEGSSFSAPKGASITLYCVADTGYNAVLSPSVAAPNYAFTVSGATTVTAAVTKINYALTGVVSPSATNSATGTIKFYSNAACTTEITTATYQQVFYARYFPPAANSEYYVLSSFTVSGTGTTKTSTSNNIGTFKMGSANATITANVAAATPTFGTCSDMTVYAGESFTYTGANLATLPNSTLSYTFRGTTNTTGKFTAPTAAGTYTLTITASNKPTGISTAATATKNVTITVKYHETSVTYYVDMHNNSMSGKTVEVAIVSNAGGTTVLKNSDNKDCKATLTQQGSSTVYSATIATPVTKNGTNYSNVYVRVKYGTDSKVITLSNTDVQTLMDASAPEIWIEARNEAGNTYKVTYATNSATSVASGKKRIYVAKPYSWQNDEPSWKNLKLYHWGDYTDIGWNNGVAMTYVGNDTNFHYYYVDVDSGVNNIIFQGWKDSSTTPDAQTANIENIGTANYFVLSKDGNAYSGTKGENATVPGYTRYVSNVAMNVGETANIAPTHTGAKVTYSSNSSDVSVNSSGVITAVGSTFGKSNVTITVKVFGTVGAKVTSTNPADMMTYTVSVSVRNPGVFNGYNIMSFAHQEYTVIIPKIGSDQPGYFDLNNTFATVNGLYDGTNYTASYANSAVITPSATVSVSGVGTMPASVTVKYAASNSSKGYSNITLTDATVTTKSIKKTGAKRYGFKNWNPAQSIGTTKAVDNGVETATHKGLNFVSGTSTYQVIFEEYDYVDVTFNFKYDEYVPQVVNETEIVNGVEQVVRTITNYQYDADWAAQAGSHITKTYTVSNYEVRNLTASTITTNNLIIPAGAAIEVLPENDYYKYKIESSGITIDSKGSYVATVTVTLTKSLRKYSVYLNGALKGNNYNYQEYADLSVASASKWYAVSNASDTNTSGAPLLATGTGYKFRVKGNTYLRTVAGTISDDDFNRSENGFSHYEVTHKDNKENLLQNFYIADFFDKDKVKDLARGDGSKTDEANFVGGGVVYYSMTNGTPYSKAVDAGYVNSDGTANTSEIAAMLKRNIEASYSATLAGAIGEEDAMKVAYGKEIPVTNNRENGAATGVLYRYLPLENYSVDSDNNITTTPNSDVFRYSNSLQSYQYIYASGNENKATNNGKNMRLYSYYIYSYLTYDKNTNLPQVKYEVVLSDQYSDASTYWAGTN